MKDSGHMNGIFAVVLAVNNLDEAVESYKKLGFEFLERTPRAAWGLEAAQFKMGGNTKLELLAAVDLEKPTAQTVKKFLDKNGEGVYQIAVLVDDLDAVYGQVKESGARMLGEPHFLPSHPGVKVMWVSPKSTHGVFLEFMHRGEAGHKA
jgi:methylmalonyl-CoA/ethylmalonyl-CoA epimerase